MDKNKVDMLMMMEHDQTSQSDNDKSSASILPEQFAQNFNTKQIVKLENFFVPLDLTDYFLTGKIPSHLSKKDIQKMKQQTLQGLAARVNAHQQIHFDILELLNSELKTRPTFRQTIENFRLNIPRIKEARIQERDEQLTPHKEKLQSIFCFYFKLADDSIVKTVSDRYFAKDEKFLAVDGLKSKDHNLCDLYVDTHYIDYMLSNLNQESQYIYDELKRKVEENTQNITKLLDSHEREYKWIQSQMIRTIQQSNKTNNLLTRTVIAKFKYQKKKLLYGEWKRFLFLKKLRRQKLKQMTKIFRNYHQQQAMNKIKFRVKQEAVVQDHTRVEGAYVLINQLKTNMKKLDVALQRIYEDKSDKAEFALLKTSVDPNRAKTIFNDMKELFDTSIQQYKEQLEIEKQKMREAFQFMIQETGEKCDRRDLNQFTNRIAALEQSIHQLFMENAQLRETNQNHRLQFTVNKFYTSKLEVNQLSLKYQDEAKYQKEKIAALELQQETMANKVDYFIGIFKNHSQLLASKANLDEEMRQSLLQELQDSNINSNNNNNHNFNVQSESIRVRRRQQSAELLYNDASDIQNKGQLFNINSGNIHHGGSDLRPQTSSMRTGFEGKMFSSRLKTQQKWSRVFNIINSRSIARAATQTLMQPLQ